MTPIFKKSVVGGLFRFSLFLGILAWGVPVFANQALLEAVRKNDLKAVQKILKNDPTADVNYMEPGIRK